MNEHSLHSEIKKVYSIPGDKFEVKLDDYVVDILRGQLVIEVQTKNFSAIRGKLETLTEKHQVRLVYPLTERKWITCFTEENVVMSRRRSPKKGKVADLFRELVMIADIVGDANFSLEVLLIDEEEIRCNDGRGSWRRRGASIKERRLLQVNSRFLFKNKTDYLKLLPDGLNQVFTNRELSKLGKIPIRTARQITYCLRKSGAIILAPKRGRELVFQLAQTWKRKYNQVFSAIA